MPSLVRLTEETRAVYCSEGLPCASWLACSDLDGPLMDAMDEITNEITPAVPGDYPSAATYPSSATYPCAGSPEIPGQGLLLDGLSDSSLHLTSLQES